MTNLGLLAPSFNYQSTARGPLLNTTPKVDWNRLDSEHHVQSLTVEDIRRSMVRNSDVRDKIDGDCLGRSRLLL